MAQYIKEEDGTWTKVGGMEKPLEEYSTTETIVGTWIDGKPIYRRIVHLNNVIVSDATEWTSTGITIANADKLINTMVYRLNYSQTASLHVEIQSSSKELRLKTSSNSLNSICGVLLEYTKTTD